MKTWLTAFLIARSLTGRCSSSPTHAYSTPLKLTGQAETLAGGSVFPYLTFGWNEDRQPVAECPCLA